MTCLKAPTDDRWLEQVLRHPERLLADHAHCEKKAAATAMSLMAKYPDDRVLVRSMLHLAQEELEHFARLYAVLEQRNLPLGYMEQDRYVKELLTLCRPQGVEHTVDRLLVFSLVEARSCERFVLLAKHLPDPELQALYHELSFSEAGHHQLFVSLAGHYQPKTVVAERLDELTTQEAEILRRLPPGPRMH
ncbi:MAG TPA: tRNA-(ms[2]io[6]A)-hydroxylase [Stenomitos sp.]